MDYKNLQIKGNKVILRSLRKEDVSGNWWQWFNDTEVTKYMNKGQETNTVEKQMAFFEKMEASDSDFVMAICNKETKEHIGTTAVHRIRMENGKKIGNFGIIIGDRSCWKKGFGTEAWKMLINYAFSKLNLDGVDTLIFLENIASRRIAEKLGFELIEIRKNEIQKGGKWIDRAFYHLSRSKWMQMRTKNE